MGKIYPSSFLYNNSFSITASAPIDDRFVVERLEDLTNGTITSPYQGLCVYVNDVEGLYTLKTKTKVSSKKIKNWKRIDSKSVYYAENIDSLTDGTYSNADLGTIVYIKDRGLYIYIGDDQSDLNCWKLVEGAASKNCLVTIDEKPADGSGLMIESTNTYIEDYISDNEILKAGKFYTSNNTESISLYFDENEDSEYYIHIYDDEENWMVLNLPEDLTLSIKKDDGTILPYENGTYIKKGDSISFNKDFSFVGLYKEYGGQFDSYDYKRLGLYKSEKMSNVYAYNKNSETRILTECDMIDIDENFDDIRNKIDNLCNTLMIDPDGSESEDAAPLQDVIINMNNAIKKLDDLEKSEKIEIITNDEIDSIFE